MQVLLSRCLIRNLKVDSVNARVPLMPLRRTASASAGFTLFELVIVILLLGIVAVAVLPKAFDSGAITLGAQARTLAADLQRAQLLATSTGKNVLVCADTGAYIVQIGGTCPSPLPALPQSSQPVVVALDKKATFDTNSTLPTLVFNSRGEPNAAADYKIWSDGKTSLYIVSVAALSGLVSIATP